uniref:C-type lectin domain-containing protein n=1 Tax=Periophthalmus magnuspinnatus TaxID=409849 RepID=A0A3B3ZPU0_9GOBI
MIHCHLNSALTVVLLSSVVCELTGSSANDYILINESRSWMDAQTYCRERYTDLATVWSEWDLWELCTGLNCTDAWIGLNNQHNSYTRTKHWSQVGQEYTEGRRRWSPGEPSDHEGKENCMFIQSDLSLSDQSCCSTRPFICYDERSNISVVISRNMSWSEALHFCRQRSADLLSGWSQLEDPVLQEKIQASADSSWWVGLFIDPWIWSNTNHSSSFRHWDHKQGFMCEDTSLTYGQCVSVGPKGTWTSDSCTVKKTFICYNLTQSAHLNST